MEERGRGMGGRVGRERKGRESRRGGLSMREYEGGEGVRKEGEGERKGKGTLDWLFFSL